MSPGHCSLQPSVWFFPQTLVASSHTYTDCSAEYSREPSTDLWSSLCVQVFSSLVLCSENSNCLYLPGLSAAQFREFSRFCLVTPPYTVTEKSLKAVRWDNCRAHLICFHLAGTAVFHCLMFSVLKTLSRMFCLSCRCRCFRWEGNLVPVTPSWPEDEVCSLLLNLGKIMQCHPGEATVWLFQQHNARGVIQEEG